LPPDFLRDSSTYIQQRIGRLTFGEACHLLGNPLRRRPSFDENKRENGDIFTFADPSHKHRQLELDFEPGTGPLRSLYVYPLDLSWLECTRLWGSDVSATKANKGRIFYSYLDRRLDVLVGPDGKVISLGMY
jgi:hypothetical protein